MVRITGSEAERITKNLKAIEEAGGKVEDKIRYLRSEGFDVSDTGEIVRRVPFLSTEGIEENLAFRREPTRFEKNVVAKIPEWKKSVEARQQYFPTPERVLGEAIDIPIDLFETAQAIAKTKPSAGELAKAFISGMATNLGTSIRHPIVSVRERPLQTLTDYYILGSILKGTYRGLKKLKEATARNVPLEIGKEAEGQLIRLRNEIGNLLGEEKRLVSEMRGIVNTREIIIDTLENIKNKGMLPLRKDLPTLRRYLYELGVPKSNKLATTADINRAIEWAKGKEVVGIAPGKALEIRDALGELELPKPKPGEVIISKGTDFGDVLKLRIKEGLQNELKFLDMRPELGGTGGKWTLFNEKYRDVMDVYRQVVPRLESVNAEGWMEKVGKKILEGDTYYTNLWKTVDKYTGLNTTEKLLDYAQLKRGFSKLPAPLERIGITDMFSGLGDISAVGFRRLGRLAESLPTTPLGLAGATLKTIPEMRLRLKGETESVSEPSTD